MKFFGHAPVIGTWLLRRTVRSWSEAAVQNGDSAAVRELVCVFCTSSDQPTQAAAHAALSSLHDPGTVDAFCTEVMIRDDARLTRIAAECRYASSDEAARALFFFATGDWDALGLLDPLPSHPLLFRGYTESDERMRMVVLKRATESARCHLFAHALIGDGAQDRMSAWSVAEWELVMQGLLQECQWDECWRLLFSAPLPVAVPALHCLRASGWVPPGDERALWNQLIGSLPETWTFPAPEPLLYKTLERPVCHTTRLAFPQDGSLLATSGSDGMVRVWRVASGTLLHAWQAGKGAARALAFAPDGRRLACAGEDGLLRCWDPLIGTLLWDTEHEPAGTECMAVTPDSAAIISGGTDGRIRIMDRENGHIITSVEAHGSAISQLAISPDGRRIASAGSDGTICIHGYRDTVLQQECTVTQQDLRFLAFTCGSDRFATVGNSPAPIIRDVTSGKAVQTLAGDAGSTPCTVSFYETGVAIGSDDHTLSVWQFPSGTQTSIPVYHQGIASCTTNSAGSLLVAGCNNGTIRFFGLPGGTAGREYLAHTGPVIACACSPDGTYLASCSWDGTVKLWGLPDGNPLHVLRARAGDVTCLCSTPDGSSVITGNTDGTLRWFSVLEGHHTRTLDMYTSTVTALAISPDGMYLACAGGDNSLRLWRTSDGVLLAACEGLTSTTRCLTFTPDGKTLVSGGWDGKVRFWQVPHGNLLYAREGHTSAIVLCATAPGSPSIVTMGNDTTVQVRDPVTGQSLHSFYCGKNNLSASALSPDGRLLVLGGKDGSLCTIRLPSGCHGATLPKIPVKVTTLAFTRDSEALLAGYETGTIGIFSLADSRLIRRFPAHAGAIRCITPLPNDDLIVTSGGDGACRVWNLPFTRSPKDTCPDDISRVADIIFQNPTGAALAQWQFLEHFLHGRFRHEIEICTRQPVAGAFDIQIVG